MLDKHVKSALNVLLLLYVGILPEGVFVYPQSSLSVLRQVNFLFFFIGREIVVTEKPPVDNQRNILVTYQP